LFLGHNFEFKAFKSLSVAQKMHKSQSQLFHGTEKVFRAEFISKDGNLAQKYSMS